MGNMRSTFPSASFPACGDPGRYLVAGASSPRSAPSLRSSGSRGHRFALVSVVSRNRTIDGRKSFLDVFERLNEGGGVISLRPARDRRQSKKSKPKAPKKRSGSKAKL